MREGRLELTGHNGITMIHADQRSDATKRHKALHCGKAHSRLLILKFSAMRDEQLLVAFHLSQAQTRLLRSLGFEPILEDAEASCIQDLHSYSSHAELSTKAAWVD